MDLKLDGKTTLVTGGSRGIGASTARQLAKEGADVVVVYHQNKRGAEAVANDVRSLNRRAWTFPLDLTEMSSIDNLVDLVKKKLSKLDILILCAGRSIITPFNEIDSDEWHAVMDVNLNGPFLLLKKLVPVMSKGASVVTVSSVAAHTGVPRHAHYAAAKAGLINLTKSAARVLAPDIRVNCVAPGITRTEMGQDTIDSLSEGYADRKLLADRFATPEEVAQSIVFLASPVAGFIHGATLDVNGGRYLR